MDKGRSPAEMKLAMAVGKGRCKVMSVKAVGAANVGRVNGVAFRTRAATAFRVSAVVSRGATPRNELRPRGLAVRD